MDGTTGDGYPSDAARLPVAFDPNAVREERMSIQFDEPAAEQIRRQAADLLDQGAETMLGFTPANDRIFEWSRRTGAALGRAARYLRERSADDISHDTRRWVSENPLPVLAGAATVGFLVGALLRRR